MKGKSHKEVYVLDSTKLQASYKTELPFKQLTSRVREADVLPGLKTPLMSVNKMAEESYTTIFHLGEEGVTVHKPGTLIIATSEPPILQGGKQKGAKLWTISAESRTNTEQANNADDLPPRICRIPSCRHMDQRNQGRKLQHLANNHSINSLKTLPRIR